MIFMMNYQSSVSDQIHSIESQNLSQVLLEAPEKHLSRIELVKGISRTNPCRYHLYREFSSH